MVASLAAVGVLPIAVPPSLTKSCALRSRALPTPTTSKRGTARPAGATMSRAEPFLPLNRSAAAARAIRSPVGSTIRRAADPNLGPSSQNKMRTPLGGTVSGANSSFRAPDMAVRPLDGIRRSWKPRIAATGAPFSASFRYRRPVSTQPGSALKTRSGTPDMTRLAPACKAPPPAPAWSHIRGFPGRTLWPPGNGRRINVLLCILKGVALAQPLCCSIKYRVKRGSVYHWDAVGGRGPAHRGFCRERGRVSRMGSIGRYIFRTTIGAFLVICASVTALMWITQALRDIDLMTNQGQSILVFIGITGLIIPLLILIIAPIALMIAVAHVLNKLGNDSELIVMNAAGMPPWFLFRPFLAVGVVVSLLVAAISIYVSPWGLRELRRWATEVRADLVSNIVQP